MSTCFIFAQYLNEEACLCVRLGEHGQLEAPLASRSPQETKEIQLNARTLVVLPTDRSSLHELELPWLPDSKARAAIPYALEEELAQNVATLHFAYDWHFYRDHHYLIVVIDKAMLVDLTSRLHALDLDFDGITLDWFALKEGEACVTENGLLIHHQVFKGALSGELTTLYLEQHEGHAPILTFQDTHVTTWKQFAIESMDSLTLIWIAQRLQKADIINLSQGELRHDNRQQVNKWWYRLCGGLAGFLLVSVLVFKLVYLYVMTTKTVEIDKKIAVIYRQFFPEAKQVISPKFRIGQLLSASNAQKGGSVFWFLLDKLALSFKGTLLSVEQFRYQNQVLSVTLVSQDFAALEKLEQQLQHDNVKVTQSQAASQDHQVRATLELR